MQALRKIGVVVLIVDSASAPDLLCWYRGCWTPIEVKTGRGKLTALQAELYRQARFPIVRTVDEALAVFGMRAPAICE